MKKSALIAAGIIYVGLTLQAKVQAQEYSCTFVGGFLMWHCERVGPDFSGLVNSLSPPPIKPQVRPGCPREEIWINGECFKDPHPNAPGPKY